MMYFPLDCLGIIISLTDDNKILLNLMLICRAWYVYIINGKYDCNIIFKISTKTNVGNVTNINFIKRININDINRTNCCLKKFYKAVSLNITCIPFIKRAPKNSCIDFSLSKHLKYLNLCDCDFKRTTRIFLKCDQDYESRGFLDVRYKIHSIGYNYIRYMNRSYTHVKTKGINKLLNLEVLKLGYNNDIYDISSLTKLKMLELGYNNSIDDISMLKDLEYLDLCTNNSINDLTELINLKILYINENKKILDISSSCNLKKLHIGLNNKLNINHDASNLEVLYLGANTTLRNVENFPNLVELAFGSNNIISDLSNLKKLKYLWLDNNNLISSSDIAGMDIKIITYIDEYCESIHYDDYIMREIYSVFS